MTDLERMLSEIEGRVKAATPDEWPSWEPGRYAEISTSANDAEYDYEIGETFELELDDCELIANAPTDLARLCAALRLADEALADLEAFEGKPEYYSYARASRRVAKEARTAIAEVLKGESK